MESSSEITTGSEILILLFSDGVQGTTSTTGSESGIFCEHLGQIHSLLYPQY